MPDTKNPRNDMNVNDLYRTAATLNEIVATVDRLSDWCLTTECQIEAATGIRISFGESPFQLHKATRPLAEMAKKVEAVADYEVRLQRDQAATAAGDAPQE